MGEVQNHVLSCVFYGAVFFTVLFIDPKLVSFCGAMMTVSGMAALLLVRVAR
jgi:hypothetical protein